MVLVLVVDDCRASTVETKTETEEWLAELEASLVASGVVLSGVVLSDVALSAMVTVTVLVADDGVGVTSTIETAVVVRGGAEAERSTSTIEIETTDVVTCVVEMTVRVDGLEMLVVLVTVSSSTFVDGSLDKPPSTGTTEYATRRRTSNSGEGRSRSARGRAAAPRAKERTAMRVAPATRMLNVEIEMPEESMGVVANG